MAEHGPQPGWYDDPDTPNRQRYWDGDSWTEHRQTLQSPEGSDGPARNERRRNLLLAALGVALLLWGATEVIDNNRAMDQDVHDAACSLYSAEQRAEENCP